MMKNEHYRQSLEHSHEIYLSYDLSACYKTSRYLSCLGNLSIGGLSIEHGLQNGLQLVIRFSLHLKLYKTFHLQLMSNLPYQFWNCFLRQRLLYLQ